MNLSKEDQEFVKTYDDSKYAKPSVTADMVIFARLWPDSKALILRNQLAASSAFA